MTEKVSENENLFLNQKLINVGNKSKMYIRKRILKFYSFLANVNNVHLLVQ